MKSFAWVAAAGLLAAFASHGESSHRLDEVAPCDVLVVFAHPDDETMCTGTLAKMAEEGKSIQLVYATSGEAASEDKTGRGLTGAPLAEEREREMACAAKALGLAREPVFLRYPDGGVYESRDAATEDAIALLEATKPQVVITFGPDGGYGHPDHIAVGQIADRAFDATGAAGRLLHVALSKKRHDVWLEITGQDRFRPIADELISIVVDVKDYLEQRKAAMACHATQFNDQQRAGFMVFAERTGVEEFLVARQHAGEVQSEIFTDHVSGYYVGNWYGPNPEKPLGDLTCTVTPSGEDKWSALFFATFGGVGEYEVGLDGQRDGERVVFGGEVDLGETSGGVFAWDGAVEGDAFNGKYTSKMISGTFKMMRAPAPDAAN